MKSLTWRARKEIGGGADLEDEALPDAAGGVVRGVLVLGEVAGLHEGDGDGVAEEHLDGGGGDGGEVEGAELALEGEVDAHVAGGGQGAAVGGGEGDEVGALGAGAGGVVSFHSGQK